MSEPQTDTVKETTADDVRINAMLTTLSAQRENGLNFVADLKGEIAAMEFTHAKQVGNLQAQIADLQKQLAAAKAPEVPPADPSPVAAQKKV